MMIETKQISAALVKAQKAFAPALKTSTNPHFKSRYADLSACIEAVIDSLNANGIALIQKQHPSDGGVSVETVFVHESGETLSAGILSVPAAKQDPQGYGSALTYARRYSLMAACGIAPEDDDGNASAKPQAARKSVPNPKHSATDASGPEQDSQAVTAMVNRGDAALAAATLQKLPQEKIDAIWNRLASDTADAITAAW